MKTENINWIATYLPSKTFIFLVLCNMVNGKPRPLVLFGPSGSGKSTLLKKMLEDFPDRFGFSVSHTTRKPRPGEQHGVHYYFTDWETMKKEIEEGKFIEHALYSGNHYGTSKAAVEAVQRGGKVMVVCMFFF